jgi:hypothetical protein
MNKILHQPLVSMRKLEGGAEATRTLSVVQDLFHLDSGPQEAEDSGGASREKQTSGEGAPRRGRCPRREMGK